MTDISLADALNRMLSQEHACAIRYLTHAAVITGPYAEAVAARLKEIAADELLHAEKLRARILALGATPTMEVRAEDLRPANALNAILSINIDEEKQAIEYYTDVLNMVAPSNVILFQTVQEIIRDEQEHLEELQNLSVHG